jgi:uncharacterized protein YndB with AHSA1/START domain
MMTHRHAIYLARDPAEVFAYLTEVDNLPRWQSTVVSVRRLPGPARGVGTRVEEVRCLLGHRFVSRWTVTDHVPAVLAGVRIEQGPLQGLARYWLTPERNGTHLAFEVRLHRVELPLPIRRAGLHAARVLLAADALRLRDELEVAGAAVAGRVTPARTSSADEPPRRRPPGRTPARGPRASAGSGAAP